MKLNQLTLSNSHLVNLVYRLLLQDVGYVKRRWLRTVTRRGGGLRA